MTSIVKQVNVYAIVRDSGTPLYKASIWIGEAGEDPEYSPKRVWFVQEEGQQFEGKQPIITGVGGFPFFEGDKVAIKVEGDFSIRIRDFSGAVTYESLSGNNVTFDDGEAVPLVADLLELPTNNYEGDEVFFVAETAANQADGFHVIFRVGDQSASVAAAPDFWLVPDDRAGDGSEGAYQKVLNHLARDSANINYTPDGNTVETAIGERAKTVDLAATTGATLVGYDGESANVKLALDARVPTVATLGELPANPTIGLQVRIKERDNSLWEAVTAGSEGTPDGYGLIAGTGADWLLVETGVLSPKMFGAVGGGVVDDVAPIKAMIQFMKPFGLTGVLQSDIDANRYISALSCTLDDDLYRHTETLYIPNIKIVRSSSKPFKSANVTAGLYYDPVDTNTAAVVSLIYKRVSGTGPSSVYDLHTDITELVTTTGIDTGLYRGGVMGGEWELTVITAPQTTVGVRLANAVSSTFDLAVGQWDSTAGAVDSALCPRVGISQESSFAALIKKPHVLATDCAHFAYNANSTTTLQNPYYLRPWSNENANETLPAQYAPTASELGGALGFFAKESLKITLENPAIEQFHIAAAAENTKQGLIIRNPNFEAASTTNGRLKHCVGLVASSLHMYADGLGTTNQTASSILMVRDCTKTDHTIIIDGNSAAGGQNLLTTHNTTCPIQITSLGSAQVQSGKIWDASISTGSHPASLVAPLGALKDQYDIVYLDVDNGVDTNWGLNTSAPVKNIDTAVAIAHTFGCRQILITTGAASLNSTATDIPISKSLIFQTVGGVDTSLNLGAGSFTIQTDESINLQFNSIDMTSTEALFEVYGPNNFTIELVGGSSASAPSLVRLFQSGSASVLVDAISDVSGLTSEYVDRNSASTNVRGIADVVVFAPAGQRNTGLDASPTSADVHVRTSYFA